jgi:hypothetical protein
MFNGYANLEEYIRKLQALPGFGVSTLITGAGLNLPLSKKSCKRSMRTFFPPSMSNPRDPSSSRKRLTESPVSVYGFSRAGSPSTDVFKLRRVCLPLAIIKNFLKRNNINYSGKLANKATSGIKYFHSTARLYNEFRQLVFVF